MLKTAILAVAFSCAAFAVSAAEECAFPFNKTVAELSATGAPVRLVPADELDELVTAAEALTGKEYGDVTRGFLVIAGGKVLLGLEVNDCLIDPIAVGVVGAAPASQLSGKGVDGKIGA